MVVDMQFTKWVECYPLPDQGARSVARAFVDNFISRFGSPCIIHSDQGRQFESDLFTALCTLLEVTKTRTTGYHPSGNGQVERYNRTLMSLIRAHLDGGSKNWDVNIPLLAGAIRGMVNRQTGFTANMMMLGREVKRPIEHLFGKPAELKIYVKNSNLKKKWYFLKFFQVKNLFQIYTKTHKIAQFLKIFSGGGGGACPQQYLIMIVYFFCVQKDVNFVYFYFSL